MNDEARINRGLIPRAQQAAHSAKIRVSLLEFLNDESFTTADVVQRLVGYKSKQGALGVLQKLTKEGLIKHHKMKNFAGGNLNLWGITPKGIYAINDPDELPTRVRGFEPSRVSLATLDHKIQIQLLKIYIKELGWSVKKLNPSIWDRKIPDIICTKPDQDEELIALEVELTIKSQKRYADIITSYKSDHLDTLRRVVWLTETEKAASQLKNIFRKLDDSCLDLHRFMSIDAFMGKGDD
jgi:hypothetical protein